MYFHIKEWAVSDRMKKDLAIRALDMASALHKPLEGCIFHSDRGSQYCSYEYQKRLQKYALTPSMSGKGNCYDNASVETFFKTILAYFLRKDSCRHKQKRRLFVYGHGIASKTSRSACCLPIYSASAGAALSGSAAR